MFEIVCEDCGRVIAQSDSISDAIAKAKAAAKRGDAARRDPFWDDSGEWFCISCAEDAHERRYSGDPAPTGPAGNPSPMENYLRQKGEI